MAFATPNPDRNITSIVFIDGSITDLQVILSGLDPSVTGDAEDSVSIDTLSGTKWTDMGDAGVTTVDGVTYHQYIHITGAVTDHLYVQDVLTQIQI